MAHMQLVRRFRAMIALRHADALNAITWIVGLILVLVMLALFISVLGHV